MGIRARWNQDGTTPSEYPVALISPTPAPENERGFALLTLLDENTDMGPAMAAPTDSAGATVVLATDAEDEAAAVRAMLDALTHEGPWSAPCSRAIRGRWC